MKKTISEFYNELNSNATLRKELKDKSLEYRKKNKSNVEMINEIVLPIAKKLGFNFSAKDIIDYENELSNTKNNSKKQELSMEDLENVNGGLGVRTAAISLFAVIGLSSLSTASMSFADNANTSASMNDTSTSISQTIDQNVNITSSTSTSTNQISQNANSNQQMSETQTIEAVINEITTELKYSEFNKNSNFEADTSSLHSTDNNTLAELIKNFDKESKAIADKLNSQPTFQSLNALAKNNSNVLSSVFSKIKDTSLTPREKVAANLILDDWANLNGLNHYMSLTASPYFVNAKGETLWPDNNGYKADSAAQDIISAMKVGYKIDRYGSEYGFYVASANGSTSTSYAERALASRENKSLYNKYHVTRNFSELSNLIDELGLTECLSLETQAVNVYKEIKDKIKPDFQIHNKGTNPYAVEDGFNYQQLRSLVHNTVDSRILVSDTYQSEVQANFNAIKNILVQIDEGFENAAKSHKSEQDKIESLRSNVKGGFINLTDNVKNAKVNSGEIAPAFKQQGGGMQIELPCGVSLLKSLGFLQNVSD